MPSFTLLAVLVNPTCGPFRCGTHPLGSTLLCGLVRLQCTHPPPTELGTSDATYPVEAGCGICYH
eukprot:5484439-Amphidinium_carterae.1